MVWKLLPFSTVELPSYTSGL